MHALPEAMVPEAEMSLESVLSKQALIQQIPDLHGTEHLGSESRDYEECGAGVPIRETIPQAHVSTGSDRIALHIHPGVKRCMLGRSASLEPGMVVGQALTCIIQSIGSLMFGFPRPGRGMGFSSQGREQDEMMLQLNLKRSVKIPRTCRNRRLASQRNGSL